MALDLGKLQKEANRLATGGGFGQNLVRMPEGKGVVLLRLLSKPGTEFFQRTRIHNVNGKNIHCPRELADDGFYRGPCPICEYYTGLWKHLKNKPADEAEHDKTIARSIKPIERYYYNTIVRNELNQETGEMMTNVGPKILGVGKTLHEIVIDAIVGSNDSGEKYGDVTDPLTGRDFRIVKNLKKGPDGEYPDYVKSKFEAVSPLGTPEEVEKWLAAMHNLSDLRKLLSYEEMLHQLRIHFGIEKDTTVGFDMNEFNKVSGNGNGSTSASAPKVKVTEEEDDEPESVASVVGGDETLADADFIKGLGEM
jgi:hypothetical protein